MECEHRTSGRTICHRRHKIFNWKPTSGFCHVIKENSKHEVTNMQIYGPGAEP